jgi:hypothetical protein
MKNLKDNKYSALIGLLFIIIMVGGCATVKPPALSHDVKKIDLAEESICLIKVKIANKYKPSYQPDIKYVFIWEDKKENRKKYSFNVKEKYNEVKKELNEYLISFQLPPGRYKLREFFAQSGIFPVIGTFSLPIYTNFNVEPNKIIYLGNIDACITERTSDDELRAGPVIPLIDQAITGASGGKFVIEITDNFDDDTAMFKQKYFQLTGYEIINLTIPPWKKPTEADMQ